MIIYRAYSKTIPRNFDFNYNSSSREIDITNAKLQTKENKKVTEDLRKFNRRISNWACLLKWASRKDIFKNRLFFTSCCVHWYLSVSIWKKEIITQLSISDLESTDWSNQYLSSSCIINVDGCSQIFWRHTRNTIISVYSFKKIYWEVTTKKRIKFHFTVKLFSVNDLLTWMHLLFLAKNLVWNWNIKYFQIFLEIIEYV